MSLRTPAAAAIFGVLITLACLFPPSPAVAAEAAEIELVSVEVGTPSETKPYLLTRAGRTLPIKVTYRAAGEVSQHRLQVHGQAYGPKGKLVNGFSVKTAEVVPKEGENSISSYIRVPRTLTRSQHMGSYRLEVVLHLDGSPIEPPREEVLRLGSVVKLKRAFLDPAVLVPEEEIVVLMDLDFGGWPAQAEIPIQVRVDYKVGRTTRSDSFAVKRRAGMHYMGLDRNAPSDIPVGEGSYKVTVSVGGSRSSAGGKLLVVDQGLIKQTRGYASRGRRRIQEGDQDLKKQLAAAGGTPIKREFVRPVAADGGAEASWDFGEEEDSVVGSSSASETAFAEDLDLDITEEELEQRRRAEERRKEDVRRAEEAKRREEQRRAEEERRAKDQARREAEAREREEEDARKREADRVRREAARQQRLEERERKKRKDLPPEDDADDFDFGDLADDEEEPGETGQRRSSSRRSTTGRSSSRGDRSRGRSSSSSRGGRRSEEPEEEDLGILEEDLLEEPPGGGRASASDRSGEDDLAEAESEELDEEDLPGFVYFRGDEDDVLLAAEVSGQGVLYISGTANRRTLVWLEEWEAAAAKGAPKWFWILDERPGRGRLRFRRFSSEEQSWTTVWAMPSDFDDRSEEKAARSKMRRIFRGYVPKQERTVPFGDL
ncbi:MAG: hypothetical protein VX498_03190 [Myxococcota bacterium]|nr:hypothetical protein [Myxococcota bacterium]